MDGVTLRLLYPWNGYDPGEVRIPHPGLAEDLVRWGLAELVTPGGRPEPKAGEPKKPKKPK
jgi:hypothetical protein